MQEVVAVSESKVVALFLLLSSRLGPQHQGPRLQEPRLQVRTAVP